MTKPVYSIRDWDLHFENAQSRKVERLDWVRMPIKHDGKSFRRIMLRSDAAEVFAAWVLIVEVAAKCPTRGILLDADGPLDATDLAIKTGFREASFAAALNVLSSKEIGWLVVADWELNGSLLPLEERRGEERREEEKREEDCGKAAESPPLAPASDPSAVAYPEFPCIPGRKSGARKWLLTEAKVAELASAFPATDVPGECRRAYAWIMANLDRRKTAGGMPDFLFRWMAREQNSGRSVGNGRTAAHAHSMPKAPPRRAT